MLFLRFFEYQAEPITYQTPSGNLTAFVALPTNLRLHPTYSKVSLVSLLPDRQTKHSFWTEKTLIVVYQLFLSLRLRFPLKSTLNRVSFRSKHSLQNSDPSANFAILCFREGYEKILSSRG